MNYIKHLTGFFDRAAKDHHLNCTHMSLYMAIFQLWNLNRFKNPISLSRSELMGLSKVSSNTTYHKCMKELQQYGYLRYDPSYHPLRGSWVFLFQFDGPNEVDQSIICAGGEQVLDKREPGDVHEEDNLVPETHASKGLEQPLNIYKRIKHTKHSFKKNKKDEDDNSLISVSNHCSPNENVSGELLPQSEFKIIPQDINTVVEFFRSSLYPESQAVKFFHYFTATGWKVGGKAKIENWHAAAHSWMLNAETNSADGKSKRRKPDAERLHSKSDKDYNEPL